MEAVIFLSIIIALFSILVSCFAIRRVKKQIAEITDALIDVKNGNGNRRILSATNELVAPLGTSISAAKIAFLNSFPVICVMNWTSGLMMDNLQKDNLLPEAYAIVPTTFHTIFIMAITVVLSLWLIIRFYKKWTR